MARLYQSYALVIDNIAENIEIFQIMYLLDTDRREVGNAGVIYHKASTFDDCLLLCIVHRKQSHVVSFISSIYYFLCADQFHQYSSRLVAIIHFQLSGERPSPFISPLG